MLQYGTLLVPIMLALATQGCHDSYYHKPQCRDHPDGYSCDCGPGYVWNSNTCVATGLDSFMEFSATNPARYAVLLDKAVPQLAAFSVAMWLRTDASKGGGGTVLSYSLPDDMNIIEIRIIANSLRMLVFDEDLLTGVSLSTPNWLHIVWTWTSIDGSWKMFVNGTRLVRKGISPRSARLILGGGELVLGQSGRRGMRDFDTTQAFVGDLSQVHVWSYELGVDEAVQVYEDCQMMKCGNVMQWADLRIGTRGPLRIRWPSGIYANCTLEGIAAMSCDFWCSIHIGPQCNAGLVENVEWGRTRADTNATVPCPGSSLRGNSLLDRSNASAFAFRECRAELAGTKGTWSEPVLDACIDDSFLLIRKQVEALAADSSSDKSEMLDVLSRLVNQTGNGERSSIMDITVIVRALRTMVHIQRAIVDALLDDRKYPAFGVNREFDRTTYPSLHQTQAFLQGVWHLVDNLLSDEHRVSWEGMLPPGTQGDRLMQVWDGFMTLTAHSIWFHTWRAQLRPLDAHFQSRGDRVASVVHPQAVQKRVHAPCITPLEGREILANASPSVTLMFPGINPNVSYNKDMLLSCTWMTGPVLLPNHNVTSNSSEDIINSPLLHISVHHDKQQMAMIFPVITASLPYLTTLNISNPECVQLQHEDSTHVWRWTRTNCTMLASNTTHVTCRCVGAYVMAVTTDMYDANWESGVKLHVLLSTPSYLGCTSAALLSLITFFMLIYFRTSSKTSSLHKHFAISIFCSQMTLILGIDKIHSQLMCQIFAISFHYFFLTEFLWLMNEAFNLYIVITYAAHSHGEHTEGGSKWRYYILGWIFPAVVVGAFLGTHKQEYYASDMCLIKWEFIWPFLGPSMGICMVTVLVLIFTAKEHHESSYSKNEKTNKMIAIYSRALWTQTILIVVSWFFAFLSLRMPGIMIKWLYCLFSILQGAFFFVFFLVMNEEVQAVYKARVKRIQSRLGHGYSLTSSMEEVPLSLDNPSAEVIANTGAMCRTPSPAKLRGRRGGVRSRRVSSKIEAISSEDDSDCEMMVTSV